MAVGSCDRGRKKEFAATGDNIDVFTKERQTRGQHVGMYLIIIIQEKNIIAGCFSQPKVAGK